MAEAKTQRGIQWLLDKLETVELQNEELEAEVAIWRERAMAAELERDRNVGEAQKVAATNSRIAVYESAIRQIVNNPTMRREDVQGRLLTILQDQGAM